MSSSFRVRPAVAAALMSIAVPCAGLVITPAFAHAEPFAKGPYSWCPGQPKKLRHERPTRLGLECLPHLLECDGSAGERLPVCLGR